MFKTKRIVVMSSVVLLSMGCVSAQAGLFSWLFGEKEKTQENPPVLEERRVIIQGEEHNHDEHNHSHEIERPVGTQADYQRWLDQSVYNRQTATDYEKFLVSQLGKENVPPMHELLTTARSWQKCGYDPYQVPPSDLWGQMLPTIRLYNTLKSQGVLPPHTQIRSVYRSPELNRCAGGAAGSKHITNGAMDIWIPDYKIGSWQMSSTQDKLCQFWIDNGKQHEFGLGIYATGAIHLDTQGYRKWGGQFTQTNSPCRYVPPPKPEALYIDGVGWANSQ